MDFSSLNIWAILVATLASFALGALWYSVLFGKIWQREVGITDEDMKGANMAKIFGTCLILTGVVVINVFSKTVSH